MEKITELIGQKPELLGIVFAAAGVLILIGAILKWKWVIGSDASGNRVRTGLFGWLVYKLFGRRVFFIFTGAVITIAGIVWYIAMGALG